MRKDNSVTLLEGSVVRSGSHLCLYRWCVTQWTTQYFHTLSLHSVMCSVCGSSQLPAAATEHLVREPAGTEAADHCYQVAGGFGGGHGAARTRSGLLGGAMQQGGRPSLC